MNPVEDKQDEAVAPNVKKSTLMEKAKKTAVAVSGGTLVAVGIPLIPLPGEFESFYLVEFLLTKQH